MSDIIEILGEKKFAGSRNTDLKSSIVLEETNQTRYDNNLFYTLSQQTQFINEKRNCNNFKIYGNINPIFSLDVNKKTTNGLSQVQVNSQIFDMNLNNWSIVILKSKQIQAGTDANNNQLYSKGVKNIKKYLNDDITNNLVFNLNLSKGLPAKEYKNPNILDNFGLYFPLGHNFSVGDKIKIDSSLPHKLPSGFYVVEIIDLNTIYINYKVYTPITPKPGVLTDNVIVSDINDVVFNVDSQIATTLSDPNAANLSIPDKLNEPTISLKNLTFSQTPELIQNLTLPRPKVGLFLQPDFYVTKIVEKEALEYYVKVLEVVEIIDELDNCGFSKNFLNQQIKNYFLNRNLNVSTYFNNKGEPLTDIYIGIIKNGSPDKQSYRTVESHFYDFIDYVSDNDGLEMINTTDEMLNKKTKVGDTFYYCICEHTTEGLTETELAQIHHRFIHNDVLFNYKPFYKVNLKLKSPYIEDSDTKTDNVPAYSVYSRQREKYIWRDIFDVGVADENGSVIDFPYMNDSLYVFNRIDFFVRSEKRATKPYKLNLNDLTNATNGGNEISDLFDDILSNINEPTTKPYNQYKDQKC